VDIQKKKSDTSQPLLRIKQIDNKNHPSILPTFQPTSVLSRSQSYNLAQIPEQWFARMIPRNPNTYWAGFRSERLDPQL
jgi:hypothetical protein